jgi:uncharacterized protein with gpF-like domain
VLTTFFRDQARAVAEEVEKQGPTSPEALLRPEWDEPLEAVLTLCLEKLAAAGAASEWRRHGPKGHAPTGRKADEDESGMKFPPDVQAAVERFVRETMGQPWWRAINDGVRADLAAALQASLDAGENGSQTAKRVAQALGDASSGRAERIARPETTGALNAGASASRDKLHAMGVLKAVEWLAIVDGNTRPAHLAANGQRVNPGEDFVVGGERCRYPGDVRLTAGNRVHCRCTALSVMKDESEL